MILEFDSALFVLRLFWHELWLGAALVLLVGAGLRTSKRCNAATRHWIWALAFVAAALLPLGALLPPAAEPPPPPPAAAGGAGSPTAPGAAARARDVAVLARITAAGSEPQFVRALGSGVLFSWLAGSAWLLLRLARSAAASAALRREAVRIAWPGVAAEVRVSTAAHSPMVVGMRHPSILLPAWLFDGEPAEVLDRVLDHELAHIERGDHWIVPMQRVIEALYFFHPALRYAARRLDDEREISCDDRAAAGAGDRYAQSLVKVCRDIALRRAERALAIGAAGSRRQLARRVRHQLDSRQNHAPGASGTAVSAGAALLIALAASAAERMPRVAGAGDGAGTRYAYAYGNDYRYATSDGTPLIEAAAAGDISAVGRLLDRGADPSLAVAGDGTPLIAAARRGDVAMARLLLDYGADVNGAVAGDGNPLIMAAANGHTAMLQLLLERGAAIDVVVPGDENALINAARSGAIDAVRLLLAHGADVEIAVHAIRRSGETEVRTALSQARTQGHDEVAELLIKHGASR